MIASRQCRPPGQKQIRFDPQLPPLFGVRDRSQHRLLLRATLADVNVAPQRDGAWLSAISGAALSIDIGLRARRLLAELREGTGFKPLCSGRVVPLRI
jgi:hypothetical protein